MDVMSWGDEVWCVDLDGCMDLGEERGKEVIGERGGGFTNRLLTRHIVLIS